MKAIYLTLIILSLVGNKKEGSDLTGLVVADTLSGITDIGVCRKDIPPGNEDSARRNLSIVEYIQEGRSHFVYISLKRKQEIAIYKLDAASGYLSHVENIKVNGSPGSLALSATKKYVYAALRSTNQVASFKIDSFSGILEHIKNSQVAGNPVYISPDKTNRFLLTAYFGDNLVAVYPIIGDSIIGDSVVQRFSPGTNPHCILNHPNNKFTYVTAMTSGYVNQYSFNEETGKLLSLTPEKIELGENVGPRHITFHPNGKWVYIVNEINNTVNAYEMNSQKGTLTLFDTKNTLPISFTGYSKTADIHITPNGKYLYLSNRGHNSIAGYSINQEDGTLELINYYDTEPNPREFEIDETGNYLFSGGEDSGKIGAYKINDDGTLILYATYDVGESITWIMSGAF